MTSVSAQIFVDASATGMNDGSSWINAYTDLKAAINSAAPNSELWITAGVYSPGATTADRFQLSTDLKLYGGFNGTETALSQRD